MRGLQDIWPGLGNDYLWQEWALIVSGIGLRVWLPEWGGVPDVGVQGWIYAYWTSPLGYLPGLRFIIGIGTMFLERLWVNWLCFTEGSPEETQNWTLQWQSSTFYTMYATLKIKLQEELNVICKYDQELTSSAAVKHWRERLTQVCLTRIYHLTQLFSACVRWAAKLSVPIKLSVKHLSRGGIKHRGGIKYLNLRIVEWKMWWDVNKCQ